MPKYTPSEQARVLVVLASCGGNVTETARLTQIPETTIRDWKNGGKITPDVEVHTLEQKQELANVFWKLVNKLTGGITEDKIESATLPQVSTAIGILSDKALLLEDVVKETEIVNREDEALNARANTQQTGA